MANNFEMLNSQKGKPKILYNGKLYSQKLRKNTKKEKVYHDIHWKCISKRNTPGCHARMPLNINVTILS